MKVAKQLDAPPEAEGVKAEEAKQPEGEAEVPAEKN